MADLEIKTCGTEFKAGTDEGEYEGHFSVFGNRDSGDDVAEPGMFKKTLQENGHRVKVFYAHDWMKLIGPTPRKLLEDSIGLLAAGKLTLGSFWGRETWALMKDNALNEGSFGYQTVKSTFDDDGARHLWEVKLFEISPVPLGMNMLTSLRAVKSAQFRRSIAVEEPSKTVASSIEEWDSVVEAKAIEELGSSALRASHAWFDVFGNPDDASSYKFLHHKSDGTVSVNSLMSAAMDVIAEESLPTSKISAEELSAVKQHLSTHFSDLGANAPWDMDGRTKTLSLLNSILAEIRDGKVLATASSEGVNSVKSAVSALAEELTRLTAVEPDDTEANHSTLHTIDFRLRAAKMAISKLS